MGVGARGAARRVECAQDPGAVVSTSESVGPTGGRAVPAGSTRSMDDGTGRTLAALVLGAGGILAMILRSARRARERSAALRRSRRLRGRMEERTRQLAAQLAATGSQPSVPTGVLLGAGEQAYYDAPATLRETTAVRRYQSTGVRIRVARGVSVGGTSARSTSSQEWTEVDSGRLTITSRRLIFDGTHADRTVRLPKVVGVSTDLESVEVSTEGRQRNMVFRVPDPQVAEFVLRACCGAEDPRDRRRPRPAEVGR